MAEHERLGDRYEVLRTISEGRRASVLQALDHVHDRMVALKVYRVTDDDRDALLAEARVLMSFPTHPGLPVVRGDFFTDEGDRYVMVMDWVDGTDLQDLLDEEGCPGLPLDEVIDDLAQVADALDHLHAQEPPIVHGDVKPANVVRAPSGRVVLVDFDIAGAESGAGPAGTLGYAAPEVAAGAKPTPAADVFGLASTAVTLLNGRSLTEAAPTYPGIDAAEVGHLARALRGALAVDPAKRPRSAGRLVEKLRGAARSEHPTGVVALLATEVADAGRLWGDEPDDMRIAMARLRDLRDEVVDAHQGRVVSSMNEGDHSIVVFREPSAAALGALDLHDRVRAEHFPPGLDVRLRAAVAVGEAPLVDGAYTGPVVDQVLRLRSVAAPGATVTSEATAELLIGLVGRQVSIVPIRPNATSSLPNGASICGLTRPGREKDARVREEPPHEPSTPLKPRAGGRPRLSGVAVDSLLDPLTLTGLTIAGLALIFLMVLSPELGMGGLAAAVLVLGGLAGAGSFAWRWSTARRQHQAQLAQEQTARDARAHAESVERDRSETRQRLREDFAQLTSDDADDGARTLEGLADEFAALTDLLKRVRDRPTVSISSRIPELAEDAYRQGMSVLSDAIGQLKVTDGAQSRDLPTELEEIEDRLARGAYSDERDRSRDQKRQSTTRRLLDRQKEARQRARDLIFQAETCTAALAEAGIELASVYAGDTQVDTDAVVHSLEDTIRCVRDVQDELRSLGY
ncbi:MAG: protein kinase domain-containing protein [Acidimicrobiales bacterium]